MNIEPAMKKRLFIGVTLVLALVIIAGFFNLSGREKNTLVKEDVPKDISSVAISYININENAIGFHQSSPLSWIEQVRSIATPDWYKSLKPSSESLTSSSSFTYNYAHEHEYEVFATTTCKWVGKTPDLSIVSSVTVRCAVYDTVKDKDSITVDPSTLPYGWSSVGQQDPRVLQLSKNNTKWYVSNQPVDQQTE